MRILLLGFGKIAYMPYMNFYLDVFKGLSDIEIDLVYWDRDGKPDAALPSMISKSYKFESHLEEQLPFKKKLFHFRKYRSFVKKVLKNNVYDKIIVLHTTPGLTILDVLLREYSDRYILDFRDISYEYISIYKKIVSVLSNHSAITFVSSDAYRAFLPNKSEVITIHNYSVDSLEHRDNRRSQRRKKDVLRVRYWGLVRQLSVNKKVMDALGNDARFELHYHGRMQQDGRDMENYSKECGYRNIFFHGPYMPNDRYSFAQETDLIHNIYDLGHTTGNAMGNKFYDGAILRIPQICMSGSQMGKLIEKNLIGITVDLEEKNIADMLWNYYGRIDWATFDKRCDLIMQEICEQQGKAEKALLMFVQSEDGVPLR